MVSHSQEKDKSQQTFVNCCEFFGCEFFLCEFYFLFFGEGAGVVEAILQVGYLT